MKTYAIINQKGGVGKSITALSVGAALTLKGYTVLCIDLDAQGNLSYTMKADTQGYSAMELIQRPETAKDGIQHTEQGDIIASSPSLSGADTAITQTGKEYRLKEALEVLDKEYEYCIIDTPPSLGILTINALTASLGVIIPAQADVYSIQGINQLHNTIQTVKHYCSQNLCIMGILLTRYSKRSVISQELADTIDKIAKKLDTNIYKTRIRECVALRESQTLQQNIFTYAPKCNAAADYRDLVTEILEQE